MKRGVVVALAAAALMVGASDAWAGEGRLFELRSSAASMLITQQEDKNVIDLISDFIEGDDGFPPIGILVGYSGTLNYLGIPNAVTFDVMPGGTSVRMRVPSTGTDITFNGSNPSDISDQIEDWFKEDGIDEWTDFLRAANGLSPLAVISGNPKSTVALMGDSPFRKFGYDDSRSHFGFGEKKVQRIGGFELRLDAGAGSVNTANFDDDLATVDAALTLAGQFGRYVGLSFSIIGQYRDYNGSEIADLGLELALPVTLLRPDTSEYFWQLTPFFQAGAGASIDAAAGGLFLGGGVVNVIGLHRERWDIQMANEIAYYGGIPLNDIDGYDFDTKLEQWFFKNGVEGTLWLGAGFYADTGLIFTNFAKDRAAVPWYATPTVGVGWQAGRWMDIRIAYEADVDNKDYRAHNGVLKLDFWF